MAVFNTNQVRHIYVTGVNDGGAIANAQATPVVMNSTYKAKPVGYMVPVVDNTTTPTQLYFTYKGVGGPIRTDLINLKNAKYYSIVNPADDIYTLKAKKVSLRSDVNGGDPVAGQDYVLSIELKGFVSGFEEDTYTKQGMVHAFTNMDAKKFYNAMALSLYMNFSREIEPCFTFWLGSQLIDEAAAKTIKEAFKSGDDSSLFAADGVTIQEAPLEWSLGRKQEDHVFFSVNGDSIVFNGDELMWANVEDVAPNTDPTINGTTIPNSHRIADLEYFCMGERGDIYRNVGWPNTIFDPSSLLVDPNNATGYFVFNLHFAFTDTREGVQRSEKDLQIVAPTNVFSNLETLLASAGVKKLERSK